MASVVVAIFAAVAAALDGWGPLAVFAAYVVAGATTLLTLAPLLYMGARAAQRRSEAEARRRAEPVTARSG